MNQFVKSRQKTLVNFGSLPVTMLFRQLYATSDYRATPFAVKKAQMREGVGAAAEHFEDEAGAL